MNSAIAAASFSRASPSTNRVSRARCSDIAKNRDHGRRIGRGDDRAEQEASDEGHLRKRPQRQANSGSGDQGRNYRKTRMGAASWTVRLTSRGNSRLEDEQREKDINKNRGVDGLFGKKTNSNVDRAGKAELGADCGQRSDANTNSSEHNGLWQVKLRGKLLAYTDHDQ